MKTRKKYHVKHRKHKLDGLTYAERLEREVERGKMSEEDYEESIRANRVSAGYGFSS